MTERPILFSAPMVRALLAGTKTQTRRLVKLPHQNPLGKWEPVQCGGPNGGRTRDGKILPLQQAIGHSRTGEILLCPHGQPGDRLWVRETWAGPLVDGDVAERYGFDWADYRKPTFCSYAADGGPRPEFMDADGNLQQRWTSGIHMFRWASRILLEVTEVRVERLQDISEADAKAEGASFHDGLGIGHSGWRHDFGDVHGDARSAYARLWEQINGPGSWAANPWVWAVSFRMVTP